MDVNPSRALYLTMANIGRVFVQQPNHQKAGGIANVPQGIVHVKDERFLFTSDVAATKRDSLMSAVH